MSPYIIPGIRRTVLNFEAILQVVAQYLKISEAEIFKKSRKKELVFGRKLIFYLCRKYKIHTRETFLSLASRFGQDHTSAIHAVQSLEDFISIKDEATIKAINAITAILRKDFCFIKNDDL